MRFGIRQLPPPIRSLIKTELLPRDETAKSAGQEQREGDRGDAAEDFEPWLGEIARGGRAGSDNRGLGHVGGSYRLRMYPCFPAVVKGEEPFLIGLSPYRFEIWV